MEALRSVSSVMAWKDRETFIGALDELLDAKELTVAAPLRKAILAALGERDESAEICRDEDGEPEPDSELGR